MTKVNFDEVLAGLLETPMVVEEGTSSAINMDNLYDTTIYEEPDGSHWLRIFHHNNPSANLFASSDAFTNRVYKNADLWYDIERICARMDKYEFMVKQKDTNTSSEKKYRWIQTKNPIVAVYADVQPSNVTHITTEGYEQNTNSGGLYVYTNSHSNPNARMAIATVTAGNWYGAAGSWTAYQGGIPGFPTTTCTTGYMDIYIRFEDDTVNKLWTYRKWSNGVVECWGQQSFNTTATIAWGSSYYTTPYGQLDFPTGLFMNSPALNITRTGGFEGHAEFGSISKDSINNIYITRPSTAGVGYFNATFYAVGKWSTYDPSTHTMDITGFSQTQMTKAEIRALIENSGNIYKDNNLWIPTNLE